MLSLLHKLFRPDVLYLSQLHLSNDFHEFNFFHNISNHYSVESIKATVAVALQTIVTKIYFCYVNFFNVMYKAYKAYKKNLISKVYRRASMNKQAAWIVKSRQLLELRSGVSLNLPGAYIPYRMENRPLHLRSTHAHLCTHILFAFVVVVMYIIRTASSGLIV